MIVSVCACAQTTDTTKPSNPTADNSGNEQTEFELSVTLKDAYRLIIGDETFDVKSVVELKNGHTADELDFTVVSDESVASVDANGILTRKGYGQVSVNVSLKSNPAVFSVFNATFTPANLYGTTYKGGFKKADGSLGNEITLVLNEDKSFTLKVGAGQAKYMDTDYELDAKSVGEFTGTFDIDVSSGTPVSLTSAAYSAEPVKAAFGKTTDGDFCIRIKLNTVTVEGELKSVTVDLAAK